MPDRPLPGVLGRDYTFQSYGGKIYVVYTVNAPGVGGLSLGWRVYDTQGYQVANVHPMTTAQFRAMQYFGNASEIVQRGTETFHPLQQQIMRWENLYGPAPFMHDREVLGVMLMAWAEGWDAQELQYKLQQTHWYQSTTQTQRDWINLSSADRNAQIATVKTQMQDTLRSLYGPDPQFARYINSGQLGAWAQQVASGGLGSIQDGLAIWTAARRREAEGIQGSVAWQDLEKQLEEQRSFANRPEDMFQKLREESMAWLGPTAMPDDGTLRNWATQLVTAKSSEADWQQWIEARARALYPFLGPGEKWQDRASSYKNIAEQQLGAPIGWDDQILGGLEAQDQNGKGLGTALSYTDFTRRVRQSPRWWGSGQARQEGFDLLASLNNLFNGVS